jgi:predicted flap endonuclease-1-like 5' DNA nuclease
MRILRTLSGWWRRVARGRKRAKTQGAEQPGAEGAQMKKDAPRPQPGDPLVADRTKIGKAAVRSVENATELCGENIAEVARRPLTGAAVNAPQSWPVWGDDLTVIRGIGQVTQRRLHVAGIQSYADLARATPNEIEDALIGSRRGVKIEQWIAQARRLSEIAGPPAR